ncbi:MAG: hypothetical protein NC548_19935 [Lachnospiraceae bacterium]|nr:hypothetical protein [Lachnospiraceae bacterium]
MGDIPKLSRTSSLHQIIEVINALNDSRGERDGILNTLVAGSIGVKEVYRASNNIFISGEVYNVATSGLYQIIVEGTGSTHILIENSTTGDITEHNKIQNSWTSPEMLLSEGDKVIFWASSDPDKQLTVTLSMTGNFFSFVSELSKIYTEFNDKVSTMITEYSGLNASCKELIEKADRILNNHTNQVAQFQDDLAKISKRIEALP